VTPKTTHWRGDRYSTANGPILALVQKTMPFPNSYSRQRMRNIGHCRSRMYMPTIKICEINGQVYYLTANNDALNTCFGVRKFRLRVPLCEKKFRKARFTKPHPALAILGTLYCRTRWHAELTNRGPGATSFSIWSRSGIDIGRTAARDSNGLPGQTLPGSTLKTQ